MAHVTGTDLSFQNNINVIIFCQPFLNYYFIASKASVNDLILALIHIGKLSVTRRLISFEIYF